MQFLSFMSGLFHLACLTLYDRVPHNLTSSPSAPLLITSLQPTGPAAPWRRLADSCLGLCTWCLLYWEYSCPRRRMAHSPTFFKSLFKTQHCGPSKMSTPPWSFLSPFLHHLFSWVLITFPCAILHIYLIYCPCHPPPLNIGSTKARI